LENSRVQTLNLSFLTPMNRTPTTQVTRRPIVLTAFATVLSLLGTTGSPAQAQAAAGAVCPAQLSGRLDRLVSRIPGQWSVLVQNQAAPGQRQNLYANQPASLLVPASNNKVFTTAAALAKLGGQYQLRTPVLGDVAGSELATLRIVGQGDPSFSTSHLRTLAQQLKQRGVRRVNLLIGDDTVFQGEPFNPFWATRHRGEGYAAPVNSLLLNENNIYDSSVPNPGNYLVGEFRRILTSSGIQVVKSTLVKRIPASPNEIELAAVLSPPLSRLINETNQSSNNVYAESLLKTLGRLQDPTTLDTSASGVNAVRSILTDLGVNPNRYSMVDGSGLADRDRASAEAFVQTLQAMASHPEAQTFRRSMAVSGRSGTLTNRMANTSAAGIVFAKTGTLRGSIALSGYINPPNYAPLVFSMIVNSDESDSEMRAAIDAMVVTLSRLRNC
jgi:serine-type D-Ala-D-Ala carboxypeptidase/endopeptidase (penicillin-binding protein 4)